MTAITSEDLYSAAFYYAVGIISSFDYYSDLPPDEIARNILQRAQDIIIQNRTQKES